MEFYNFYRFRPDPIFKSIETKDITFKNVGTLKMSLVNR